jgi:protein-S-isoprenylcysteine O-methyltransferase Ste14
VNGLLVRAILAFIALPGVVAFVVPLLVLAPGGWEAFVNRPALTLVGVGIALLLWCVREFYRAGQGTLAPWAPPRHLVVSGPYSFSRNPMYIAVLFVLAGWALGFRSRSLTIYAGICSIVFYLRVVFFEEPWLSRTHGDKWTAYRTRAPRWILVLLLIATSGSPAAQKIVRTSNPVLPGWYADPEAHLFNKEYWIYPTYSAPYDQQTFMDAFSSPDLVTWTKHARILDIASVKWATRAVWAPSVIEKDGWYYLFFGANDIQNDEQIGGIGVARARTPEGPFQDYLGKPLIDRFHNGAQPIDQFVFRDNDRAYYIVYGGWKHCNIARLNDTFTGFVPFPDGTTFREITPEGYVEGAFMLIKDGRYYFMWSEGGWTGPNYAVAYAVGSSPFGPFTRVGTILRQDPAIATGAGHHSVIQVPGTGQWYIVYHRRPLGDTDRNHRVVCIDELRFDENGAILPVTITNTGVSRQPH